MVKDRVSGVGYFDLVVDRVLGAKIANISIMSGFLAFACQYLHEEDGWFGGELWVCYMITYIVSICICMVIIIRSYRNVKYSHTDYVRLKVMWCKRSGNGGVYSHESYGCFLANTTKIVLVLCSLYLAYSVMHGAEWYVGQSNVYPYAVMAVISSVYAILAIVIVVMEVVVRLFGGMEGN